MAKLCPLMSELRWAYPLLSTISLLSFLDIFLMHGALMSNLKVGSKKEKNFIKLLDYYGPKGKARAHSGEIGQNWSRSVKIGQNWSRLPILDLPWNGEAARVHGCRSLTRDHRTYKLILYYNTICFLFLSIVP